MQRVAVAVMLVLTTLGVVLALWEVAAPFVPHEFWGVSFDIDDGHVTRVFPDELPPGARIVRGDRGIERPDGDPLRGYRLRLPVPGDTVHVVTTGGVVPLHPSPHYYPRLEAAARRDGLCLLALGDLQPG